jgi:hypothetical protein
MIIWPAIVPTTELEIPEAINASKKMMAAAAPNKGVRE